MRFSILFLACCLLHGFSLFGQKEDSLRSEDDFGAIVKPILLESTRTQKDTDLLPAKVDVLTQRIEQSASADPSTIVHLIGFSPGIQLQTFSASSGSKLARINGLPGQYTQILRDGFPIYGGLSGSLDLLQIAPLDLRQVEILKGPASTYYGGGAIGGLINLVTKRPESNETLLHENLSTIGARDFNAFISKDLGKFGFTSLATLYMHRPYDSNSDGYSDMPDVLKIHFSPRAYYRPNKQTEISLGGIIMDERRTGGDMKVIDRLSADSSNFFFDTQLSRRLSSQLSARHSFNSNQSLRLKNSVTSYSRRLRIRENSAGDLADFDGKNLGTFSELEFNFNEARHDLHVGVSLVTDRFTEVELDTVDLRNQRLNTYGVFLSYVWNVHTAFALETGLRADYVQAESVESKNSGQLFVLPNLNALVQLGSDVSLRVGGGLGYRMPSLFSPQAELRAYKGLVAIDYANLKAEQSLGGHFTIRYSSKNSSKFAILLDQNFFYTLVDDPLQLNADSLGNLHYVNSENPITSAGAETQLGLKLWKFSLDAAYTYTNAFQNSANGIRTLPFTPMHSVKGELAFANKPWLRIACLASYNSEQSIASGFERPSYVITSIVVEGTVGKFGIFANFENLTDLQQSNYEGLLSGSENTTQYAEIWAPLDGFFFNWGVTVRF